MQRFKRQRRLGRQHVWPFVPESKTIRKSQVWYHEFDEWSSWCICLHRVWKVLLFAQRTCQKSMHNDWSEPNHDLYIQILLLTFGQFHWQWDPSSNWSSKSTRSEVWGYHCSVQGDSDPWSSWVQEGHWKSVHSSRGHHKESEVFGWSEGVLQKEQSWIQSVWWGSKNTILTKGEYKSWSG